MEYTLYLDCDQCDKNVSKEKTKRNEMTSCHTIILAAMNLTGPNHTNECRIES